MSCVWSTRVGGGWVDETIVVLWRPYPLADDNVALQWFSFRSLLWCFSLALFTQTFLFFVINPVNGNGEMYRAPEALFEARLVGLRAAELGGAQAAISTGACARVFVCVCVCVPRRDWVG